MRPPPPPTVVSSFLVVLPRERKAPPGEETEEIKEDGARFCARVQHPLTLHTAFSPALPLSLPLHRPRPPLSLTSTASLARPFSRQPPLRRRLQSFRLPTPYKRSCCPFITTTPATTTTERPTATSFPALSSLSSFTVFHRSSLLPATFDAPPPATISFVSSFCSRAPSRDPY
ncbi:hypothetical protein PUN28_016582 [Cardiocondyla obscurior]|uniref:Dicer dsRNA-binding fold domain-containing protein n=1 Tax=Cardiocondyla obscurior TaxID=286306 RepID=A0AAW2ES16_9HYME